MAPGHDSEDTPGEPPLTDASSDRCTNCGTSLATDQRYCVNCGERRGRPRFGALAAAAPNPTVAGPDPVPGPVSRPRFSPGTTLVAGVATLLLAMGVGVLIGENGSSNNSRLAAASPQVIKISGGGSGGAGNTVASSTSTTSHSTKHSTKASKHKSSSSKSTGGSSTQVVHLTKKVTQQITKATSNVVGTNAHLASPTTQLGGKCTSGQAGCQNGKFTGNFFGGG